MELAAGLLELVVVGQVTDETEQDALALAAIIAEWVMIGLTADVTNFYTLSLNHKDM